MDVGCAPGVIQWDSIYQSIEDFINEWKPASIPGIHVEWLTISTQVVDKLDNTIDTAGLLQSWESLCLSSLVRLTNLDIERLAFAHNVLAGKWMIFVDKSEVDKEWAKIAMAVIKEGLAIDAKVSTSHVKVDKFGLPQEEKVPIGKHVICVWSNFFGHLEDVFALRDRLRVLGFDKRLFYKPDAYSICGIYQGNSLGLPAAKFCA